MVSTTELSTVKSRHQREVGDLKEQLRRANTASERDQALREKVFNEAKAEVMALNKKVSSEQKIQVRGTGFGMIQRKVF